MLSKLKFSWAALMCLSLVFTFISCDNDDDTVDINEDKTIVDIAAGDDQFSTLVSALQRTGLDAVLADRNSSFTVFAPTNQAFTDLGVDLNALSDDELSAILLYHVLGAQVLSSQLQEGNTYVSTASATGPNNTQLSALVSRAGTTVTVNKNATVISPDIQAENGVIHVVNSVLLPLDIVGHAVANDDFSQLVATLGAASGELTNVLGATDQVFTVFAPVNSAFEAIADVAAGLSADQLASILTYHVVGGANVLSNTLTDGQSVATVQTESFTINIDGSVVTITDATGAIANIIFTDVQATNGVIHVLDKVIMPSNI